MSHARRLLVVVAVDAEASALAEAPGVVVAVGGIGRTNAACATTQAVLRDGPFDAVLSLGIAGALPGSGLSMGALVVGSESVYVEEGILTPEGFGDVKSLGFPLGDFVGNRVNADARLLERLAPLGRVGVIATVATCSGTDQLASEVVRRTGGVAEAMEGAAVLHASRRLGLPAIEVRTISNTTGDRPRQRWDVSAAFATLRRSWPRIAASLRDG